MMLDNSATQRQAAELVSLSEESSLLPRLHHRSGSTVELSHLCNYSVAHCALSSLARLRRTAAASSSENTSFVCGHCKAFLTELVECRIDEQSDGLVVL